MQDEKTLQDFVTLLEGRWKTNGFEGNITISGQFRKFIKEVHKLFTALENNNEEEIKDAYGDQQVVAIMICFILKKCINEKHINDFASFEAEHDPSIEDLLQTCIQLIRDNPRGALARIRAACISSGYDPDECLAQALAKTRKQEDKKIT